MNVIIRYCHHPDQLELGFVEVEDGIRRYEYQVLVTSLDAELLTIAQHYRDRGDCENCFDELKNQWGWGGFTTKDLQRCRIMSRLVALVYNWWLLFARLIHPDKHQRWYRYSTAFFWGIVHLI